MKLPLASRTANGLTLIEVIVFMLLLAAIIVGASTGLAAAKNQVISIKIAAGIAGAALGLAAVFAAFFVIASPFLLFGAIKRALEPADLKCCCASQPAAAQLKPQTEIQLRALEESRQLASLGPAREETDLRARLAIEPEFAERIGVAARLSHPAASTLGIRPPQPVVNYKHWAKLPGDLQSALRSGLPPRLCVVWAVACVERLLAIFENEFHQDTRPRQAFGAAVLLLKEQSPEALDFCRNPEWIWWRARDAGCRVVYRDLTFRFFGRKTNGERVPEVIFRLARVAANYAEPYRLWEVYPPGDQGNAHMTPEHRCAWTQPCFDAEQLAFDAAQLSGNPEAEYQWQRQELARMILGWERWHEDRELWRNRLEQEWIPRVLAEAKGLPFDVPAYVERMRRELAPWNDVPSPRN